MDKKYYAYSLDGKSPSEWQPFECKAVQSSDGGRRSAIAFYKAGFIHAIDEKKQNWSPIEWSQAISLPIVENAITKIKLFRNI